MAGAAAANGEACAPGAGSPCGACKFLRRRCVPDCVFAPYFSNDQGAARFAAIHRVFGASNASKLLSHLPVADRGEAVVTIAYEAQARLRDPVYGCVAQIFALQQQVAILQAQLTQAKAQLACGGGVQQGGSAHSPVSHHQYQWSDSSIGSLLRQDNSCFPSPADFRSDVFATQHCARADAGDLQYLAQAMARCHNHSM